MRGLLDAIRQQAPEAEMDVMSRSGEFRLVAGCLIGCRPAVSVKSETAGGGRT